MWTVQLIARHGGGKLIGSPVASLSEVEHPAMMANTMLRFSITSNEHPYTLAEDL